MNRNMKTNLTLSLDSSVIAKAQRISKHRHISISTMFSNFIILLEEDSPLEQEMPPITRKALEMSAKLPQLPAVWNYKDELSDMLSEKYDMN